MISDWHNTYFQSLLRDSLNGFTHSALNYFEFYLLLTQIDAFLWNQEEQLRCKRLFSSGQLPKQVLIELLQVKCVRVRHNRLQYAVGFGVTRGQLKHQKGICFEFWKDKMSQKYGHLHVWFEMLCQEKDARRAKVSDFLTHISRVLANTEHAGCAAMIGSYFSKNCKNEVQFSTFTNTVFLSNQRRKKNIKRQKSQNKAVKQKLQHRQSLSGQLNVSIQNTIKNVSDLRSTSVSFSDISQKDSWIVTASSFNPKIMPDRYQRLTQTPFFSKVRGLKLIGNGKTR